MSDVTPSIVVDAADIHEEEDALGTGGQEHSDGGGPSKPNQTKPNQTKMKD